MPPPCSSCRDFLNREIPRLETELNRVFNIKNIDITTPSGFQRMNQVLNNLKISENRLPIIVKDITLQLSSIRKKKIHSLIRTLVTIYELGCTGQVYLPTIMYMIKIEKQAYLLLALYNGAFILPLLIVFYCAYRGMGSQRLSYWFEKRVGTVKLASALFFLVMAGLLIVL